MSEIPIESLSVLDKFRGVEIGKLPFSNTSEALSLWEKVAKSEVRTSVEERARILRVVSEKVLERRDFFAELIAREGGKPLKDALIEADRAAQTLRTAGESMLRLHGEQIPMKASGAARGHMAFTFFEPIGPVFAISAFNHPLNLIAHQVGPAFAAGCPILIKPSRETPLSCFHLLAEFYNAGASLENLAMVVCTPETAEQIVKSPEIRFLNFIGSAKVGWHLRSILAPGARYALEHGGIAPVILDASADWQSALPGLVRGGFYHSGQVCVSVQRIFVHESIALEFTKAFWVAVQNLVVGDASVPQTDCGPMIKESEVTRVKDWIEEARTAGATVLGGGEVRPGQCLTPAVLTEVPISCRLMQEEVFGPVVCINRFRDLSTAIELANNKRWNFQSSIYTRDIEAAMRASRLLQAGTVLINEPTTFRVDWMPFSGRAQSGSGVGGVEGLLREVTEKKLIIIRAPGADL